MKNGKMTYEEFESAIKNIKKANRDDLLDMIDFIKKDTQPRYVEDKTNNDSTLMTTEEILNEDEKIIDYLLDKNMVNSVVTVSFGLMATAITPVISVFGGHDMGMEYLKNLGMITGGLVLLNGIEGYLACKFHKAVTNHKLKNELKTHLKNKFANQVSRDVYREEVESSGIDSAIVDDNVDEAEIR